MQSVSEIEVADQYAKMGSGRVFQRVQTTHIGHTYPNHKGSDYYKNQALCHIGILDALGLVYLIPNKRRLIWAPGLQDKNRNGIV